MARWSAAALVVAAALGVGCRAGGRSGEPHAPTLDPAPELEAPLPVDPRRADVLDRLGRIGVIGASQTAGFGSGVGFRDTLHAALRVPHEIRDASVALMHLGAPDVGALQVATMRLREVRVVFAIDFLFWFAHGDKPWEQRLVDLREGMAMLETLAVPVFVGDLPDVRTASPHMISPRQIPSPEDLAALNAEIHAWAERQPQVHVLPLGSWMRALVHEQPITPPGAHAAALDVTTGRALQWDHLHPTALGQALLTVLVIHELRASWGGLRDDDVVTDPNALVDLTVGTRQPAPEGPLPPPPG